MVFFGLAALMALLPIVGVPEFWITQLNYIGLFAIVALGLVLLTGVSGLTSFGQAAFVGLGAYTSAYLTTAHGMSPWLTIFVALAITIAVSLVLAAVTLRMSGHYLPLATIAWGLSLYYTMSNMEFLGKYDGILGVPAMEFLGISLASGRAYFYLIWVVALLAAVAVIHLLDSRTGRAIRALKGGVTMAEAMGISTYSYKVLVFVLAAILACISGWLFAHFQRTVNPSPFSMAKGIEYLFMAVLGGVGNVWGAFVGAGLVKIIEDQLQVLLPKLFGGSGNYEIIVFGIVLVVVLKYAPQGLYPFIEKLGSRWVPPPRRVRDWADAAPLEERSKPTPGELLLDVQAVRKEFGGLVAVNDVSFTIRAGEIKGLIGPNGAGKSTTFNLITGVLSLTRGQVTFRGQPVGGLPSREIARRGMSRTFQKIEGRMKSIFYVGGVVRAYRAALDYLQSLPAEAWREPEKIALPELFYKEIGKTGTRGATENFFNEKPGSTEMNYLTSRSVQTHEPVAVIREEGAIPLVEIRNQLRVGEVIEYMHRSMELTRVTILEIKTEDGDVLQHANPGNRVFLTTDPLLTFGRRNGIARREKRTIGE
jgi:branched-chain amino acid transport system permease protein